MEPGKVGVGSIAPRRLGRGQRATSSTPGATTCARATCECTDVFDRGGLRSIYLRDPDGHILEIATAAG